MTTEQIYINEFLPNPEGTDSGNEWIELINLSNETITLSDWEINTDKKSQSLDDLTINPKSYLVIYPKIALKNTDGYLSLTHTDKTISEITYESSESGKSYSHITIKGEPTKYEWQWTTPTKNTDNPHFQEITGEITTPPTISTDFYFEINNIHITFQENFELLKSTMITGSEVKALADSENALIDYEIISLPQQTYTEEIVTKTPPEQYLVIPLLILIGLAIYLYNKSKSDITL